MIELEFWWLLALPLFFALGWAAARIDIRQVVRESKAMPAAYFRALKMLVAEDTERATDVLVELARAERGNTELQLALAGLFRRKGETERAIRIHQSLLQEAELDTDGRQAVTLELALDFLAAGLLDRAEERLRKLLDTPLEAQALPHLLSLYSAEKEWPRAIETARRLEATSGHPRPQEIAQYWCEIAQQAFHHSDDAECEKAVAEALAANYKCTRANLIAGQLALRQGKTDEALQLWQRIESQDPDDLPLVAGLVADACLAAGKAKKGANLLRGYWQQSPTVDVLEAALKVVAAAEGEAAAEALLAEAVHQRPTLLAVSRQLEHGSAGDATTLRALLGQHTRRLSQYRCKACGFRARSHYWQCPACSAWETYPARRVEEMNIYD